MGELTAGMIQNNDLVIRLFGHIDSNNASKAEEEIQELRAGHPDGNVILDAEQLQYISSAGLRVILRLKKATPDLEIMNVSSEVYEVLDMTGFTEMMQVRKAYRTINIDNCEAIGQGANGKVYRIDPETIIKVYNNPDSLPDIQRERELARSAFVLGIPTAIPYDVVRVGNLYGSVFELLSAKSLSKIIAAEPERLDECAAMYVGLLKKIHSTHVKPGTMPDMKAVALKWAGFMKDYLPQEDADKLVSLVENVPVRDTMIHGDYHTKNVMVQDGEILLIDMDTLSFGHPIFEFASMYLGFAGFGIVDHEATKKFIGLDWETTQKFWHKSLCLYFGTDDAEIIQSVEDKAKIIAYTRLTRRTIRRSLQDTSEGQKLVDACIAELKRLLPVTETLAF